MKNIFKNVILAAGILSVTACSDYLEQIAPSEHLNSEVFSSKEEAQLATNKLYGMLTEPTYGTYMPIYFGAGTDCELIDGLSTESLNTTSERGNMNYNFSTAWTVLNTAWNGFYSIINYCNLVIEGVNGSEFANDEEMRCHLGEALTIRAMCYLDLTRLWGDVPYVTDTDPDSENMYRGKTDRDVIQDACIEDLQKAIELLPWAGEKGATTERVTKGYAYGLLAQTALTRAGFSIREASKAGYENLGVEDATLKDYCDATYPTQRPAKADRDKYYKIAATATAAVITSGKHKLNPSFEDEWYQINQLNLDKKYQENLFEIANGIGVTGELGYTIGKRINGASDFFGSKGNSSGKLKLTGQFFQTFDNTGNTGETVSSYKTVDKRRDVTFALFQMKQATGFKYYNQTHTESLFYDDKQCTGPFQFYCGKWNPLWFNKDLQNVARKSGDAKWVTGINVVRMRYSQILLYYAEACYKLGGAGHSVNGGPTALAALEEVHTRAYDDKDAGKAFIDNLANENFMEALYAENAWEFAGEGIRKFDLIRWGQLSHKIVEAKKAFLDGVKLQPSQGGYPRQFFYRFKTTKLDASGKYELLEADPKSFCWFGTDVYPVYDGEVRATKYDTMDQKWFAHGDNGQSDTNLKNNLPSICDGLNPWTKIGEAAEYRATTLFNSQTNGSVRNRYIFPIGAITLSATNGTLQNSYGY